MCSTSSEGTTDLVPSGLTSCGQQTIDQSARHKQGIHGREVRTRTRTRTMLGSRLGHHSLTWHRSAEATESQCLASAGPRPWAGRAGALAWLLPAHISSYAYVAHKQTIRRNVKPPCRWFSGQDTDTLWHLRMHFQPPGQAGGEAECLSERLAEMCGSLGR